MKKVGTVSAAIGFIFLGIWIIFTYIDKNLADQFFKWWPTIIIFTGLELLYFLKRCPTDEKPKFGGLIFVVVIVFLIINVAQTVYLPFNLFHQSIPGDCFDYLNDRYKTIQTTKIISISQKKVMFLTTDAKINVKKSPDSNIRIEAEVYVDKSSNLSEWTINESSNTDGVTIDLRDIMIKGIVGDVYIPENCSVQFVANDINIMSTDANIDNFSVDSKNGKFDLANIKNIQVKVYNGKANIAGDSENVNVNMKNGKIDIDGNISSLNIVMLDGKADIKNKSEKYANIEINNGVVSYETLNREASVNLKVTNGVGFINGRKFKAGENSNVFGSGSSKINMKVGNGKISFSNQE